MTLPLWYVLGKLGDIFIYLCTTLLIPVKWIVLTICRHEYTNISSSIRVSDSNQLSVSLYTVFPFRIGHLQVVKKSINVWKVLRQNQDSVNGDTESQQGACVEEEGVPTRGSSAHLEFRFRHI